MTAGERTTDLYEEIAGYPKPPLVPLPEPGDLGSLEDVGLKSGRVSRWIVQAAMWATGFRAFQKQLPQLIEDLGRQVNLRGPVLFPPLISATVALKDDPRDVSPVERAATLLFAARSLYQDVISAKLPPDRHQGQVLEMGQYPNLFSTSLIVDDKRARVFKSTNASQITVAVARRFYSLEIGSPGSETTVEQLKEALAETAHTAQRNRLTASEPAPGILTCGANATQIRTFHKLKRSKVNADSLYALRHSFLVLCLDLDSTPSSYAEAAFVAHSGNCANRWYHSSLQLVVFGNAKACMICNFNAYLGGNVMMRAASEIQKRAVSCPLGNEAKRGFASLPPATELRWEIGEKLVQRAQSDLRAVQDNQQATFEIRGIGTSVFSAHNVKPVPAFILALQMTAWRLTGKRVKITQFLTMSKYRCMDLLTAVVTTPQVMRFVDYMGRLDVQGEAATTRIQYIRAHAQVLLQEAIDSQVRACRKARRYLPLDEILSMFVLSRKGIRQLYVLFVATLAVVLLRVLGLFRPMRREVLVSHPAIYPQVPLVGRPGVRLPYVKHFALHYQIFEDRIVITMMPSLSWTIPNVELIAELRTNLKRVQSIIDPGEGSGEP